MSEHYTVKVGRYEGISHDDAVDSGVAIVFLLGVIVKMIWRLVKIKVLDASEYCEETSAGARCCGLAGQHERVEDDLEFLDGGMGGSRPCG